MNSAVKFPYDAETAFREFGSAAVTATATSSPVVLDAITNGRGAINNTLGGQAYAVVIHVSAFKTSDTDEVYKLAVVADDTLDLSNSPEVLQEVTITATGTFALYFDRDTIEHFTEGDVPLALGVKATLTGTDPSIEYAAWLAPVVA